MNSTRNFVLAILAFVTALRGEVPPNPMLAYSIELKKVEDAVEAQIEAFAAAVAAEEKAQRIPPEEAQQHRQSISDFRQRNKPAAAGHRLPKRGFELSETKSPAVKKAGEVVSESLRSRESFLAQSEPKLTKDVTAYAIAIWQGARNGTDLVPAMEAVSLADEQLARQRETRGIPPATAPLVSFLRASQRYLDALAIGDAAIAASAWTGMTNPPSPRAGVGVLPLAEVERWRSRLESPVREELKAQNSAVNDAFVRGAPGADMLVLAQKIDVLNGKLRALSNRGRDPFGSPPGENLARKVATFLGAAERGDESALAEAEAALSASSEALNPAVLEAIKEKKAAVRDRKIAAETTKRTAVENRIHERLVRVTDRESVIVLANELRSEITAERNSSGKSELGALESDLRQLALVWAEENTASFTYETFRQSSTIHPWNGEINLLRRQAFRTVLARRTGSPELLRAPLVTLAPEAAVRQLAREIFARREWPRLYELLSTSGTLLKNSGSSENGEEWRAVKSLLTGQNFERAEQFADAVQSYRSVLTCIGELVPVDAAAERLKALKQKHPEAFPKVPPIPAGVLGLETR